MTLRRFSTFGLATLARRECVFRQAARGQDTQGPIAPKPGTPVQQPPECAIRVRVALVNAPVS